MPDKFDQYCDGRHRGWPVEEGEDRYRVEIYQIDNFAEPVHVIRGLDHKEASEVLRKIYPLRHVARMSE